MKTLADYAVPTKANTESTTWLTLLNAELTKLGLPHESSETASGYYETGHCPRTAAADIQVVRS